jgi:hypothetical protein
MASPDVEVYRSLRDALGPLALQWYVFGAQAAIHGAARFAQDIDVTVLLGSQETSRLVQALNVRGFGSRVPDDPDFVERTRVLPMLHESTAIPVDVVLGGPGLEELFASRSIPIRATSLRASNSV